MKEWTSVEEVHNHAREAIGKSIESLVSAETLQKYYEKPKNKGWIGSAIESDWFGIPNNSRHEADIPHLGLEIKVTPIKNTRNGWSAKERLVLNIFDLHDEYKREFQNSSFLEKANLIEMIYYEFFKDIPSPHLFIKAATLFDLSKLPEKDLLVIEQDWNIIIQKIKEGKAEELSDSLTKYLGATTKGSKSEKNMTTQPFSDTKAHRRAFTLKGTYMSQIARKIMSLDDEGNERIVQDIKQLKVKTFEEIILERFQPFIGKSKSELAQAFDVKIPKKNDKASSAILAKKMLNLEGEIQNTEEFKKAGITVKIVTVEANKKRSIEGFKIFIPDHLTIEPKEIIEESWGDSILREYLSSYQFMLVVYEKKEDSTVFKGAKFWHVPYENLEGDIRKTWEETKSIFQTGVQLNYKPLLKPTKTGKMYKVENSLPGVSSGEILHVRPSSRVACYYNNKSFAMELPVKSRWENRPKELAGNELSDNFMTKQTWWLNNSYMYEQVKELFEEM